MKAKALKMASNVEALIRDEFSYSDQELDEICQISIHKDYFFALKN